MRSSPLFSIYLHIPFCVHRCAYCDFNTYAGQEPLIPAYVTALLREISWFAPEIAQSHEDKTAHPFTPLSIGTIFLGGGTPSLLSGPQLRAVMDALRATFVFSPTLEATMEANPGTVTPATLEEYRAAGINRLSFGVQSANPQELHLLERAHSFWDVIQSVKWARQAGFDNLNLDVIYGLPEQTLDSWKTTLQRVVDLNPEHISAYALTLEHGTPFGRWARRGLLPLPNPDLAADMYEWASDFLASHGYIQYEISNWAKDDGTSMTTYQTPSFACRHNLQYWRALPYLGLGAGAHGYVQGYRYSNVLRIKTYLERLAQAPARSLEFPRTPAVVNVHKQTLQDEMTDFMITTLRLTREGLSTSEFGRRFGQEIMDVFGQEIADLVRVGLLEWFTAGEEQRLRLTPRGRLLGNQVFVRFVS